MKRRKLLRQTAATGVVEPDRVHQKATQPLALSACYWRRRDAISRHPASIVRESVVACVSRK
jgi:hypothetical protein